MARSAEPSKGDVGPIVGQSAVEPLGSAVGPGPAGAGEPLLGAKVDHRLPPGAAAPVGDRVVSHDPLDPLTAQGAEEGGGRAEEVGGGRGGLVGVDLGVGQPGVVIDGAVHVVIAHPPPGLDLCAAVVVLSEAASVNPPAATGSNGALDGFCRTAKARRLPAMRRALVEVRDGVGP